MTELHAKNVRAGILETSKLFDRAVAGGNWKIAEECMRGMIRMADNAIRESIGARHEADSLEAELTTYRPRRSDQPAAPRLQDYFYVFTARFPWVCASKAHRRELYIGPGYTQEFWTHDKKTVCGKPVSFSVSERFESGGWPRMHELCSECVELLRIGFSQEAIGE
ncbi:hypothetical protein ACYOEI_34140 [Singulisphaera rosea]